MLMPGERVDIWVDFSKLAGKQVTLRSLSFDPGGMGGGGMGGGGMGGGGMGGGGMGGGGGGMGSGLPMGAAFDILTVNVGRKATTKPVLGPLPALSVRFDSSECPQFRHPAPLYTRNGPHDDLDDQRACVRDDGGRRGRDGVPG